MKKITWRWMAALWLGMISSAAQAAANYDCAFNPAAPAAFSITYATASTPTFLSGSFTVTCSKLSSGSGATLVVSVAANNGTNGVGTQNRGKLGASFINYDLTTASPSAACTPDWTGTNVFTGAAMVFGGGNPGSNPPQSRTFTYYGCLPGGQIASPAGSYTDTVQLTIGVTRTSGKGTFGSDVPNANIPVSITVVPECRVSTAPGTINFTYTALQATQATANTSFATQCTNTLPYTLSLDSNSNVAVGLNYALKLNTSGSGGTNTLASTGTGAAQTFFINGTMAAGQAGTCAAASCTATNSHTLTVTY